MTDDIQALWGEFEDVITSAMRPKFQGRRVSAVGVITAIDGYDDAGHPISATLSVGNSTTEKILRPPDHAAAGDSVVVDGDADPVNRNWTIVRFLTNAAIITASSPSRALPTVVPRAALTRVDQVSYGGYRSWVQIRYDVIRRGQLDLARQGIPTMATRFRVSGTQDWTELAPARHRPQPKQTTTLASDCTATDTTIHLVASDFFPVSFNDSDINEQIRVMLNDEIVTGWYHADGTLTGCTRGVEAVGALGVAAAHLASVAQVILLVADVFIGSLAPGVSYEAQVAPVDINGTVGTWVPVAMLNFTSADLAANPANVDSSHYYVEIIGPSFEVKWDRVLLDANGEPMRAADALYQVRRLDKASTPSSDPANADWTGATRINDSATGEEELLTNPYLLWPTGQGSGAWFGVRTVRRSTPNLLYGDTIVWKKDDAPPPRPLLANITVTPVTAGYQVDVASSEPALTDRGFLEFRYHEADDTSGTNDRIVAATAATTVTITRSPGIPRYIQVVAADRQGNANALDPSYWKLVVPGWPARPWPPNGDFETVDPNYASGVQYWNFHASASGITVSRAAAAGYAGSAGLRFTIPAATYGSPGDPAYAELAIRLPLQTAQAVHIKFRARASNAAFPTYGMFLTPYYYDAITGGSPVSSPAVGAWSTVPITWTQYDFAFDSVGSLVWLYFRIGVDPYSTTFGVTSYLDIDIMQLLDTA